MTGNVRRDNLRNADDCVLNVKISPHRRDSWDGDDIAGFKILYLAAYGNDPADTFMPKYPSDGSIWVFRSGVDVRGTGDKRNRLQYSLIWPGYGSILLDPADLFQGLDNAKTFHFPS